MSRSAPPTYKADGYVYSDKVFTDKKYNDKKITRLKNTTTALYMTMILVAWSWIAIVSTVNHNTTLSLITNTVILIGCITGLRLIASGKFEASSELSVWLVIAWLLAIIFFITGIKEDKQLTLHLWIIPASTILILQKDFISKNTLYTALPLYIAIFIITDNALIEITPSTLLINNPQLYEMDKMSAPPLVFLSMITIVWQYINDITRAEINIDKANKHLDLLLKNILPEFISNEIQKTHKNYAEGFSNVSILYADIVGFTEFSERSTPTTLVNTLNKLFSAFDEATESYGLEKIKTVGDAYLVSANIPNQTSDRANAITCLGLELLDIMKDHPGLDIRIGINSGPVIAGTVGDKIITFDLWGDTVATAIELEANGIPGRLHISKETQALIDQGYISEAHDYRDHNGSTVDSFIVKGISNPRLIASIKKQTEKTRV